MATTTDQIVSDIRQLSSLFNNTLLSDVQLLKLFNDGASELYDWMVGTFETWFLTSVDFTLAGGVGGNVFAMPMDVLLKDNTLERNPTQNCPQPVPRLGTWSDRNRSFGPGVGDGRRYYPAGSNLMIFPPNLAAGDYRLWYTPKYLPIAAPLTTNVTVQSSDDCFDRGGFLTFDLAQITFDSLYVGGSLTVNFDAPNASLNGTYVIGPTPATAHYVTTTTPFSGQAITLPNAGTASAVYQPAGTVATFNTAMEPWVLYPEIHAAIAVRTSRQQDTGDLQPKLAQLKARIETATANRTEEVPQTPLRDGGGRNWYFGP